MPDSKHNSLHQDRHQSRHQEKELKGYDRESSKNNGVSA